LKGKRMGARKCIFTLTLMSVNVNLQKKRFSRENPDFCDPSEFAFALAFALSGKRHGRRVARAVSPAVQAMPP
jgi:hypothetical protein